MPDVRDLFDDLDALDRAVSEAARGAAASGTGWKIEPSQAATIRTVAAMQRSALPDPAFIARLSAQLAQAASQPGAGRANGVVSRFQARAAFPTIHLPAVPLPASPRRWVLAQVSLALLLVVMFAGLWLTAFRGDPGTTDRGGDGSILISTPAGAVSATDTIYVLRRITFEPGTEYISYVPGPTMFLVEHGAMRIQSSLDGLDRTLNPGDAGAASIDSRLSMSNIGSMAGTVFLVTIYLLEDDMRVDVDFGPDDTSFYAPDNIRLNIGYGPGVSAVTVRAGVLGVTIPEPTRMTLQRTTVPPGEDAPAWKTDGMALVLVEQGDARLTLTGEQVPVPFASGVERRYPAGQAVQLSPGVTVEARNAGDTPLVITIFAISPDPATGP